MQVLTLPKETPRVPPGSWPCRSSGLSIPSWPGEEPGPDPGLRARTPSPPIHIHFCSFPVAWVWRQIGGGQALHTDTDKEPLRRQAGGVPGHVCGLRPRLS